MKFIFPYLFILLHLSLGAHGDVHLRIESLSRQIELNPKSADLYYKRGELYFAHEDYRAAIRDFKRSQRNGCNDAINFALALSYFQCGSLNKSQHYLHGLFYSGKYDGKVYHLMAKLLELRKDYRASAEIYQTIIDSSLYIRPEVYIDLARIYHRQGFFKQEIDLYLKAIDLKGFLPAFYKPLLELYEEQNLYGDAIQLLGEVIEKMDRKEFLIYQRGLLFRKTGDLSGFRCDMKRAIRVIQELPPHLRNQSSVQNLEQEILAQLDYSE